MANRPPERLFNETRTGVARCPSMPRSHSLQTNAALRRQPHADDDRSIRSHVSAPVTIVTAVTPIWQIDRLRPSSTRRALLSLGVHPCRVAIRFKRTPLSAGNRMLMTTDRFVPMSVLL